LGRYYIKNINGVNSLMSDKEIRYYLSNSSVNDDFPDECKTPTTPIVQDQSSSSSSSSNSSTFSFANIESNYQKLPPIDSRSQRTISKNSTTSK